MMKGWFRPKTFGWGVSPSSWQGWLVTVVLIAGLAAVMRWVRPLLESSTGLPTAALTFGIVLCWLILFLAVIWLTYDRDERKT